MDFDKKSIFGFFDGSKIQYTIPMYQRAYSWTENNWKVFLADIEEASQGNNPYFYGNILLEIIETDKKYEVIDGQQRITTLILFFYSLYKVKSSRGVPAEELEHLMETYIKNKNGYKLEPVSYDICFFNQILDNNLNKIEPETPSQKLIAKCVLFFEKELSKLDLEVIQKLQDTIQNAIVTIVKLQKKKESALMFELQNNRGLSLTSMEKLKSYLMYKVYTNCSSEDTEVKLKNLAGKFEEIYRLINRCQLGEDSILTAHCQVYINGFDYRSLDDIKTLFSKIDKKVEWIEKFTHNLHRSFQIMLEYQEMNSKDALLLKQMEQSFVYPFIIKGFCFINKLDISKRNQLLRLLEIVCFKYNLINSRADLITRLNPVLKKFKDSDLEILAQTLSNKFEESWYWRADRCDEYVYSLNYYDHKKLIKYILSIYEDIELSGQAFPLLAKNEKINIEHIYPQTEPNQVLSAGYDLSALKEEEYNRYIHCLGNLLLINSDLNSSIKNSPYKVKLDSYEKGYNKAPILQQQIRIKTYNQNVWNHHTISKRHDELVKFVNTFWSFAILFDMNP